MADRDPAQGEARTAGLRRILLLRAPPARRRAAADPRQALLEKLAALPADGIRIEGMPFGVPVPGRAARRDGTLPLRYIVPASLESEAQERELLEAHADLVAGTQADPVLAPFPATCPHPEVAVGSLAEAMALTRIGAVHAWGHEGQGVHLAIVDTGIAGAQVEVAGGHSLRPGVEPGRSPSGHGTMVAFDAQAMAPRATLLDYPLFAKRLVSWQALASDAIRYYTQILADMQQRPGPWVVVNSWGIYDTRDDAPADTPQHYAGNPKHQLNLMVQALAAAGADVVFAAGNCGAECPSSDCGVDDRGPGRSIHGANAHADALSVAAVSVSGRRLGYSSQGPGRLAAQKPDLAAPSHFDAGGIGRDVHDGTSTACPIVAGAVACLRSMPGVDALTPARLRAVLCDHARRPAGSAAWNADTGFGVLDAHAAWRALA